MNRPVFVIAEAGVNHNGDMDRALALIDAAAEAGADAVKFQTFLPEALASRQAPKAEYQRRNEGGDDGQLAMLQRLALGFDDHFRLREHCEQRGIQFLSSPFDSESARFLIEDMRLPLLKLGSGELTNAPLLLQIARSGLPLILSTGMADLREVEQALGVLAFGYLNPESPPSPGAFQTAYAVPISLPLLQDKLRLLHCTTDYPCAFEQVNLRAMDELRERFQLPVGYSDHTPGIEVAVAAVARGAEVIEKHFTLDRGLPGPDHKASLEPGELNAMVSAIRHVSAALGDGGKQVQPGEQANRAVARKSLVALTAIRAGEPFSETNLGVKRPGNGRSPFDYWDLLGRPAPRDYAADEVIEP